MKFSGFSATVTTVIALLFLITIYVANNATPTLPEVKTPTADDNTSATPIATQAETKSVAGQYSGPFNLLVTQPQVGVVHIVGTGQFGGYSNQHSSTLDVTMSLANNVATYNTKNSDGTACKLQFRFSDSELNILQLEECDVERAVFAKGRLNQEISYVKASN